MSVNHHFTVIPGGLSLSGQVRNEGCPPHFSHRLLLTKILILISVYSSLQLPQNMCTKMEI